MLVFFRPGVLLLYCWLRVVVQLRGKCLLGAGWATLELPTALQCRIVECFPYRETMVRLRSHGEKIQKDE